MKKFLLFLLLFSGLYAQAQHAYQNEWIDYSKTYYKFKLATSGLYRINQSVLAAAGIGNNNAENYQLWRNGRQVPLYTSAQTGPLGPSGYIEFWGEMNDGKPDSALYNNKDHQLSEKWSLETDTVAFFLTVTEGVTNLRFVPTANSLPSAIPAEPYFVHTIGEYPIEVMNRGYASPVGEYVYSSIYDQGEGWVSYEIDSAGSRTFNFGNQNFHTYTGAGAPVPRLQLNVTGNALQARRVEAKIGTTVVADEQMDYFDYKKINVPVPLAAISGSIVELKITNNAAATPDRMAIAKAEITYPRQFNFGGFSDFHFELPASPAGNYLEITNFNVAGTPPVLYDVTNGKRYITDLVTPGNLVRVLLEPSATARKLMLVSEAPQHIKNITTLTQRNFVNYATTANQGNYLIITHPSLQTATGGGNPVEDYRAYRSSATGGSHVAKVYSIDEIVDQFGFGIKKNPISIRNFLRWTKNTYTSPVKNVLLVGKGMHYMQYRANETGTDVEKLNLVPTFGEPASDNLLACEPGNSLPYLSIGRLSVINGDELVTYLDKVKEYEQQQAFQSPLIRDKAWMKNVVHVVGASGPVGLGLAASMDRFEASISDTLYGASVHSFYKTSAGPVQQSSSQRLYDLFQEGIGLWTYYGHSSASTLEYNLDNPENYNNPGKYPVSLVLGCNAGNFYNYNPLRLTQKETLSEKFVLAPHRGSIAFIASTHFGIVHYLDILNTRTYNTLSVSDYGKTLGEIMRESFTQTFNLTTQNDFYARFHCEQATIHGDPALRLDASMSKPDYVIEDQLLKVEPAFISVAESSFKVNAQFMNLGRAIDRNIVIEVKRTYPNMVTEVIRRDTIPGIRFIDSLSYQIAIVPTRDKGLNKISICVDADNVTDELFETNNCISKDIFIFEDEVRPVFPYPYAIVNNPATKLVASTANPFSVSKQYVLEMDTTEYFNSPSKISRTLTSSGGVLEFNPGITFTDSTVYYWRVAFLPVSGQPTWNKSSFVYLSNAGPNASDLGYNQSHFFQHTKSGFERLRLDTPSRKLIYNDVSQNLFVRMGTFVTSGALDEASISLAANSNSIVRLCNWFQSIGVTVFDPVSFKPWVNTVVAPATSFPDQLGYGRYRSTSPENPFTGNYIPYCFEYRYTTPALRRDAIDFLKDSIPNGHYVVVRNYSLSTVHFPNSPVFPQSYISDWQADANLNPGGVTLYSVLRDAGFSGLDSFYRVRPWAFVYKKGDPSFSPRWLVGEGDQDNPTFSVDCTTPDTVGYITSPVFGPARAWKDLKWRGTGEATGGDNPKVDVIGVRADGTEQVVFNGIAQQDFNTSSMNAAQYPYAKLRMRAADSINYTPYQLRYWRLTYTPVPEGAMAPNLYFSARDTVEVGEPLQYKVAFKNISEVGFDSLKVKMVMTDRNNVPHIIPISKRRPLPVNDTLQLGAAIDTRSVPGLNTVYIEANPDNDQLEQFHFNNYAFRNLYVRPDSLNPLLDVTFDGVHILNRDIVSARPNIQVKLKDEARWMVLDDTSLLTLQVRYPGNNGQLRRFFFNNADTVRFLPAGQAPNNDNTATIDFRPFFTEDGEYELIITGKDKSNNSAGTISYRVIFQVYTKPMISNMLNYPNPFTTSTAFVFTITGSEVPQNIKIEIMTVTGHIVREITKNELGPLHIGRNITEFKWDGTDMYGQKLANGIYLYRVVTNLNGKSLDKFTEKGDKTDQYFNKGYGKMYLMR